MIRDDIVERLRDSDSGELASAAADEIVRLREELKTEHALSFRDQVFMLEERLAEVTAERNRVWRHEHWTEYEYNIARTEREACIDCIKAFSTVDGRAEEMIAAIRARGGNEI